MQHLSHREITIHEAEDRSVITLHSRRRAEKRPPIKQAKRRRRSKTCEMLNTGGLRGRMLPRDRKGRKDFGGLRLA